MAKEEAIERGGDVVEAVRAGFFQVRIDSGQIGLARASGRMDRARIKVNAGDAVRVELTRYDPARGRIVGRL